MTKAVAMPQTRKPPMHNGNSPRYVPDETRMKIPTDNKVATTNATTTDTFFLASRCP